MCGYTHKIQTANMILQNSNRVFEIVSQLAPSISNKSNDFKRIWTILNELKTNKDEQRKRQKDTKVQTERQKH